MKKTIKKTPIWCYISILIMIVVAMNIQITSTVTKEVVESKLDDIVEMTIQNESEFYKLQNIFQKRYGASASATYILQPKNYIKLYKEAVYVNTNDSLTLYVPNKIILKDERDFQRDLKKNDFVKITNETKYSNNFLISENESFKTLYVLPLYHRKVHIAEIYFYYTDNVTLTKDNITEMVSEIQPLGKLID